MIQHNHNHEEFTDLLLGSLDERCLKINDKLMPVELLIQEIRRIEWVLDTYEVCSVIDTLNQAASDLYESGNVVGKCKVLQDKINEAFKNLQGMQTVMERLRAKMNEVEAELEPQQDQSETLYRREDAHPIYQKSD